MVSYKLGVKMLYTYYTIFFVFFVRISEQISPQIYTIIHFKHSKNPVITLNGVILFYI